MARSGSRTRRSEWKRRYRPFLHLLEDRIALSNILYTLDADFDRGSLLNVNHTSPNNNQLQLNRQAEPFPFVNIAASARGTAVRINTDTGAVVGEYFTAPNGMGRDPSRTTVDQFGNTWVANRAESGISDGVNKGSIVRIGLLLGGTRGRLASGVFTPDPAGEYVRGPFNYNTCVDRDRDGYIRTSGRLGQILTWSNAGSADRDGGVSTAGDECTINYTRVRGTNTRTIAIDRNNDIWVGGTNMFHEKVNGVTGEVVAGTQFNLNCGGYGGLIDQNNVLWSTRFGNGLLRYDINTRTGRCLGNSTGNYGIGLDPLTGRVWQSDLGGQNRVWELNFDGSVRASYPQGFQAQGVAVDGNSHVWVAELFGSRVAHFAPDPLRPGFHVFVGHVTGFQGTTGVAVDRSGKIWASELNGNRASRINPAGGAVGGGSHRIGAIDLSTSLGAGAGPYNYSDMTGFVAIGATARTGSWAVVQDSTVLGQSWGTVTWNREPQGTIPPGASLVVEARAADTQPTLAVQPFIEVVNGTSFFRTGRFIEVRVIFRANSAGQTPVLSDLRIASAAGTSGISGWKWEDRNNNGQWNVGEPGRAGWTIFLDANGNGVLDTAERRTTTDVAGQYGFVGLTPGNNRVCEVVQAGWRNTFPGGAAACHTVNVPAGQIVAGRFEVTQAPNFGNFNPAEISGHKWNDRNGNARWDAGEPGLQGWTIYLDANGNSVLDTTERRTTTNAAGQYVFDNMLAGNHRVCEVVQAGWRNTYPAVCQTITLAAGQRVAGRTLQTEAANFGNFNPATIIGWKWNDRNANRVWDSGEPGLGGWRIFVDGNNNGRLDGGEPNVTTASNGRYQLGDLPAGTHRICEVVSAGWRQTYPAAPGCHSVTVAQGATITGRSGFAELPNFGNQQLGVISGFKWTDRDRDGVWDAGEPARAGFTIFLDLDSDGVLDTNETRTTTDLNGAYRFPDLIPGSHRVCEVVPTGWQRSYPGGTGCHSLTVAQAQTIAGRTGFAEVPNFGNFLLQPAEIAGWKWWDINNNRVWNTGEPGLANWTMFIDQNNNNVLDGIEPRTTTDSTGRYRLQDLVAGSYRVCEQLQGGWTRTYPAAPTICHTVTVAGNQTLSGRSEVTEPPNFGNFIAPATISGFKWNDLNNNNQWTAGEPALAGWTIFLDTNNNGQLNAGERSTTTNAAGQYVFDNLLPGSHRVCEVLQTGWRNNYPGGAACWSISVGAGQTRAGRVNVTETPNFGNVRLTEISGFKWNDLNNNGQWNSGEPGLANWTIFLDLNNNGVLDGPERRVTTNASGQYLFNNMTAGNHRVCEVLQTGWNRTYPGGTGCHAVTLTAGQTVAGRSGFAEVPNFGNWRRPAPGSITGYAWFDTNRNSQWNPGEPGQTTWTVFLDANGNGVLNTGETSTTTDFSGQYRFPDLAPGNHRVCVVRPAGWETTYPPGGCHTVALASGQNLAGRTGITEAPNFGNWRASAGRVLILGPTVIGGVTSGMNSMEAQAAIAAGYTVEIVDNAGWGRKTREEFAAYRALILGDPDCSGVGSISAAVANRTIWGPAATGNIVVIGTDPTWHALRNRPSARQLIQSGVEFAVGQEGRTGMYITLSCYYHGVPPNTPVPLLDVFAFAGRDFRSRGVGCFNDAHIVATSPAIRGMTDTILQDWSCSVHNGFSQWPGDWEVLAIARNTGFDYTAPDGSRGSPYILVRGIVTVISDLDLQPPTATLNVGQTHTMTAIVTGTGFPLGGNTVTVRVEAGPNTGLTRSCVTAANGRCNITYSSSLSGTDVVRARFTPPGRPEQTSTGRTVIWNALPGVITGWKWHDQDRDGQWDIGEPVLANWTVFLDANGNGTLDSGERTATTLAGQYRFDPVPAGTQRVCEVLQSGWQRHYPGGTGCHTVTVGSGGTVAGRRGFTEAPNFGNSLRPGTISGYKWSDRDGDGVWDAGETGASGWTIFLDANGNGTLDTAEARTTTNAAGLYNFATVEPGTHRVCEVAQTGWRRTFPGGAVPCHSITVAPAQTVAGRSGFTEALNFGSQQRAGIARGWVFVDGNANGLWDGDDYGGGQFFIELVQGGTVVATVQTENDDPATPTLEWGRYSFPDLAPGTYTVRVKGELDWFSTYPGSGGGHTLTLAPGQFVSGAFGATTVPNFGVVAYPFIIGWVWEDTNADGFWGQGESPIPYVQVNLIRDGLVRDVAFSWPDFPEVPGTIEVGAYAFFGLTPGTYTVEVIAPDGYRTSFPLSSRHTTTLDWLEFDVGTYYEEGHLIFGVTRAGSGPGGGSEAGRGAEGVVPALVVPKSQVGVDPEGTTAVVAALLAEEPDLEMAVASDAPTVSLPAEFAAVDAVLSTGLFQLPDAVLFEQLTEELFS